MSRVIILSTRYPRYHVRAGERTFFIEKFWESLFFQNKLKDFQPYEQELPPSLLHPDAHTYSGLVWPKKTTIRKGNHWKKGDWFSPRVWSGVPYRSKQIIIAPDIKVINTWNIEIRGQKGTDMTGFFINGKIICDLFSNGFVDRKIDANDGLSRADFISWFIHSPEYKKTYRFEGQIISWDNIINYNF